MHARLLLVFVITACGPSAPDDGETSGAATTTGPGTTTSPPTTGAATTTGSPTTGAETTTGSSTATDDSGAATVDPTIPKLDLPPERDEGPPPQPPACDSPPDVLPEEHCEFLVHMEWGFMYDCLEGADPDACPDAGSETVLDLINGCSQCMGVDGEAMCGPDPRRGDACCYWGFNVAHFCPP